MCVKPMKKTTFFPLFFFTKFSVKMVNQLLCAFDLKMFQNVEETKWDAVIKQLGEALLQIHEQQKNITFCFPLKCFFLSVYFIKRILRISVINLQFFNWKKKSNRFFGGKSVLHEKNEGHRFSLALNVIVVFYIFRYAVFEFRLCYFLTLKTVLHFMLLL